uniref:C2 domain-containing protein n=1 Tax=Oncorhynchus mykiss TaxID=8022 RepID=A0A8C7Q6C9_ONCMY
MASLSLGLLFLCMLVGVHGANVRVSGLHASGLRGDPAGNYPDPYVKVWCGGKSGGMTDWHKDTQNPSWSAVFNFLNVPSSASLKFEIWDKDLNFDDHLGTCTTNLQLGSHSVTCGLSSGTFYYTYSYQ